MTLRGILHAILHHENRANMLATGTGISILNVPVVAGSYNTVTVVSGRPATGDGMSSSTLLPPLLAPKAPKPAEVSPQPNLVCYSALISRIGYDGDRDIFKRDGQVLPAAVAVFHNDPNASKRVAANKLMAEIRYYEHDGIEELACVPSGCWLDEAHAGFSVDPAQSARLLLGLPMDGGLVVVINHRFESQRYSEDVTTTQRLQGKCFDLKVTLSAGKHAEFVYVFKFRIDLEPRVKVRCLNLGL